MRIDKQAPPGRYRYEWDEIVAAAEANPGEWIKPDREYPHSVYSALSRGKNSKFPPSEYMFRTSGTRFDIEGKRWCYIYVLHQPTESDDS